MWFVEIHTNAIQTFQYVICLLLHFLEKEYYTPNFLYLGGLQDVFRVLLITQYYETCNIIVTNDTLIRVIIIMIIIDGLHCKVAVQKDNFWEIRKRPENGTLVTYWRNHIHNRMIGNDGNRGNHNAMATVVTKLIMHLPKSSYNVSDIFIRYQSKMEFVNKF